MAWNTPGNSSGNNNRGKRSGGGIGSLLDRLPGFGNGFGSGNALRWIYVLKLPADQGGHEVDVDDWMYLVDEDTLLNRSTINKFGIRFADITIGFRKRKA